VAKSLRQTNVMANAIMKTALEHLQSVPSTGVKILTVLWAVMLHSFATHEL